MLAAVGPFSAFADGGTIVLREVFDGDRIIRFEMARDSKLARTEGIRAHRQRVLQMRQHLGKVKPGAIPTSYKQHTKLMKRACRGFPGGAGMTAGSLVNETIEEIPQELTEDYVAWMMVGALAANQRVQHALNQPDHVDGIVKQTEDMLLNKDMYLNIAIAVPFMVGTMAVLNSFGITDPLCQLYTKHIHTQADAPDWKKKVSKSAAARNPKSALIYTIQAKVGNPRLYRALGQSFGMALGMLVGQQAVELGNDLFGNSPLSRCLNKKKRVWDSYDQARSYYEDCTEGMAKWTSYQRTATMKSQITSGSISALISFGGVEAFGNLNNAQRMQNVLREGAKRRAIGKGKFIQAISEKFKGIPGKVIKVPVKPISYGLTPWATTTDIFRVGQGLTGTMGTSNARNWMIKTYGVDPYDPKWGLDRTKPMSWKIDPNDPRITGNGKVRIAQARKAHQTALATGGSIDPLQKTIAEGKVPLNLRKHTTRVRRLPVGLRHASKLLSTRFIGGIAVGLPAQVGFFFLDILVFQPMMNPIFQLGAHGKDVSNILNQLTFNYNDFYNTLGSAGPIPPIADYDTIEECVDDKLPSFNRGGVDPYRALGAHHYCKGESIEGLAKEPTEVLVSNLRAKTREYVNLAAAPLNELSSSWAKALYYMKQTWTTAEKVYRHIIRNGQHEQLMPLAKDFNFFSGEGRVKHYPHFDNVVKRLTANPSELSHFLDNFKLLIDDIKSGQYNLFAQQNDIARLNAIYLKFHAAASMQASNPQSQSTRGLIFNGLKMLTEMTYDADSGLNFTNWYDAEGVQSLRLDPSKVMRKLPYLDSDSYQNSVDNLTNSILSPVFGEKEKKVGLDYIRQAKETFNEKRLFLHPSQGKLLYKAYSGHRKDPYVYIRTLTKMPNPEVLFGCKDFREALKADPSKRKRLYSMPEAAYADYNYSCEQLSTEYLSTNNLSELADKSLYSAHNVNSFIEQPPETWENYNSAMWKLNGSITSLNDVKETITSITLYGLLETLGYPYRLKKPHQTVFKELIEKVGSDKLFELTNRQKRTFMSIGARGHNEFGFDNYRPGFTRDGRYDVPITTNLDSIIYEMLCGVNNQDYLGLDELRRSVVGKGFRHKAFGILEDGRRPFLKLPKVTEVSPAKAGSNESIICGRHLKMIPYLDATSTFIRKSDEGKAVAAMPVNMWIGTDKSKPKPEYFPTKDRAYDSFLDFALNRISTEFISSVDSFATMWEQRFSSQLMKYINELHTRFEFELKRIRTNNIAMWMNDPIVLKYYKGIPSFVRRSGHVANTANPFGGSFLNLSSFLDWGDSKDKSLQEAMTLEEKTDDNRWGDTPLILDMVKDIYSVDEEEVNNKNETLISNYVSGVLSRELPVKPGHNLKSIYGQLINEYRINARMAWSYLLRLNQMKYGDKVELNEIEGLHNQDLSISEVDKKRMSASLAAYAKNPSMRKFAGKLWRMDLMLRTLLQIVDSRLTTTECNGDQSPCSLSKQITNVVISQTLKKIPQSESVLVALKEYAVKQKEQNKGESLTEDEKTNAKLIFDLFLAERLEQLGIDDNGNLTSLMALEGDYLNTYGRQDSYFLLGVSLSMTGARMIAFEFLQDYLEAIESIDDTILSSDHKITHKSVAYSIVQAMEAGLASTMEYRASFDLLNEYLPKTNWDAEAITYPSSEFFSADVNRALGAVIADYKLTCNEIRVRDRVYKYRVEFMRSAECDEVDLNNFNISRYRNYTSQSDQR